MLELFFYLLEHNLGLSYFQLLCIAVPIVHASAHMFFLSISPSHCRKELSVSLCLWPQFISVFWDIRLEALIPLLLEQDLNLSLPLFNQVPILAATKLSTQENKLSPIKGLNWISQRIKALPEKSSTCTLHQVNYFWLLIYFSGKWKGMA